VPLDDIPFPAAFLSSFRKTTNERSFYGTEGKIAVSVNGAKDLA
jgi:hypothetical protein